MEALAGMGSIDVALGRLPRSVGYLREALQVAVAMNDVLAEHHLRQIISQVHKKRGLVQEAIEECSSLLSVGTKRLKKASHAIGPPPTATVKKVTTTKEDTARNAMLALMGGTSTMGGGGGGGGGGAGGDGEEKQEKEEYDSLGGRNPDHRYDRAKGFTGVDAATRRREIKKGQAREVLWDLDSCLDQIQNILTDLYLATTADHSVAMMTQKEMGHMARVTDERLWDAETAGAHAATGLRATRHTEMNMTLGGGH
jgi:hypothetical protein